MIYLVLVQYLVYIFKFNLQATKLLFATSPTKRVVVTTPLDLVFGLIYYIV